MNRFIIILVLVLLFKPALPVLGYLVNYDYIVKELCVNKKSIQMHCNGKCQLESELAKAAEDHHYGMHEKKIKSTESELLYINALAAYTFESVPTPPAIAADSYCEGYSPISCGTVFHPPIA